VHVLLVVDHPYAGAFTHALAAAAQRGLTTTGHEIDVVDLHADRFDPVMHAADLAAWRIGQNADPQVADYQERLLAADSLVLAFPIWWELMPAMTKGFIDKVVAKDVAYTQPKPGGLMKGRLDRLQGVSMLTVMATPDIAYRLVSATPSPRPSSEAPSRRSAPNTSRGPTTPTPRARPQSSARRCCEPSSHDSHA
jgi:NAD(P)H dehydrogenase (quinone)